jgi:hypothetical protein
MANKLKESRMRYTDLINLYKQLKTVKAVADHLGWHKQTVSSHLKKAGVSIKPGRRKGSVPVSKLHHYACLAEWIREHPDIKLPRNVEAIAEITGCTKDEVKSYLYRRRKIIQQRLRKLPFKDSVNGIRDTEGIYLPFSLWKDLKRVKVDQFEFSITMIVVLINNQEREVFVPSYDWLKERVYSASVVNGADVAARNDL